MNVEITKSYKSENTDLKDYRLFIAFMITFSQTHPGTNLKTVRMIFAKLFKIFEPRLDHLLDSNDKPAGFSFDGVTFDMKELVEWITSYSTA